MAYFSQQDKAKRAPAIKALFKEYDVKGTMSVRNNMAFVVTLRSGAIDFISNYIKKNKQGFYDATDRKEQIIKCQYLQVNHYWLEEQFSGRALEFLTKLKCLMLGDDYFDDSDIQSDYFHCSHYIDIDIGQWDKPYVCTAERTVSSSQELVQVVA